MRVCHLHALDQKGNKERHQHDARIFCFQGSEISCQTRKPVFEKRCQTRETKELPNLAARINPSLRSTYTLLKTCFLGLPRSLEGV